MQAPKRPNISAAQSPHRTEYAPGTPEDEYRDSVGLGSTDLRHLGESIDAWRHYREEGVDETGSITLGTYVHLAVLEPDRFEREFVGYPEPKVVDPSELSSTQRGVAQAIVDAPGEDADEVIGNVDVEQVASEYDVSEGYIEKQLSHDGVCALADHIEKHGPAPDADLVEEAATIRDEVWRHPRTPGLLEGADREASFWWPETVDGTAYQCKGRSDAVQTIGSQLTVTDVKTTGRRQATPGSYGREVGQKNKHMQAGHYIDGIEATHDRDVGFFVYLVVETDPPYHVQPMVLDGEAIEAGRRRNRQALERLDAWRRDPEIYTGRSEKLATIELKEWEL